MSTLDYAAQCGQCMVKHVGQKGSNNLSSRHGSWSWAGPQSRDVHVQDSRSKLVKTSAGTVSCQSKLSRTQLGQGKVVTDDSGLASSFIPKFEGSQQVRRYKRHTLGGTPGVRASSEQPGESSEVQQILVDMLRVEIGRVRMTEFVDERSQHMREIAAGHSAELNRIARQTMKRVDGFGSKVLRELDAGASEIERDLELARVEIEANERDFEEFEARALYSRNEGLFFKNLYPRPKSLPYPKPTARVVPRMKIQVEVAPTADQDKVLSAYRYILYSGLTMVVLSLTCSASSAVLAGVAMRSSKLAAYGIIISLLLLQIKYEKKIIGHEDPTDVDTES